MNSKLYHIITNKAQGMVLSQEDETILNVFLNNKENQELYNDIVSIWKASSTNEPLLSFDIDYEWNTFRKIVQKNAKHKIRKLYIVSTAIAASIAILISLFIGINHIDSNIIYTSNNDVTKITLADNSIITLNKNSVLTVNKNFNKKNRSMQLYGEAFFKVQPNSQLPFTVHIDNKLKIEVTGTSFNVRSYNFETIADVHVISGTVSVFNNKNESIRLVKGNKAIFNKNTGTLKKYESKNDNITAWQSGEFNFDSTSLSELKESIERYFNKELIFPSEYNKLSYSGHFSNPSADDFAQTIAISFGWNYSVSEKQIIFSEK